MKKIALLGDSIRLGYEKYVKDSLDGVAEVYSPKDNCKYTFNLMRYLRSWVGEEGIPENVDLVVWNAGLWDVVRLRGDDQTLTPIETYELMIKRLDGYIKCVFPNAKTIFATSTNVQEELYTGNMYRKNSDIEQFNQVAVSVLSQTDTKILDLYSLTKNIPDDCRSDMTHFNTENGVKLLGGKVLATVCKELDIKQSDLKDASCIPPEIAKEILGA